jgi:hypothetical protein
MGGPPIFLGNSCDRRDGDGEFRFWWRILITIFLQETGDGEVQGLLGW